MSLHEYNTAIELHLKDVPFYALIMAAMLKADTQNALRLEATFKDTHAELTTRHNAPGGLIPSETKEAS